MFISDKRLYLSPDGSVSEEPVSGGSLLVPRGGELPNEVAARHGLLESKPLRAVESKPATKRGKKAEEATPDEPIESDAGDEGGESQE